MTPGQHAVATEKHVAAMRALDSAIVSCLNAGLSYVDVVGLLTIRASGLALHAGSIMQQAAQQQSGIAVPDPATAARLVKFPGANGT